MKKLLWLLTIAMLVSGMNVVHAEGMPVIHIGDPVSLPEITIEKEPDIETETNMPVYHAFGDYEYRILEDGTAEVSGYLGEESNLIIPSQMDGYKVTGVGSSAFNGCEKLTSVVIPEGVTVIRDSAFHQCYNLVSVTIPEGVTEIEGYAFSQCTKLNKIVIPEGVGVVGEYAFFGCAALAEVALPESLTAIGDYAFSRCAANMKIAIPEAVTAIGPDAFYNSQNIDLQVKSESYAEEYAKNAGLEYGYIAEEEENPTVYQSGDYQYILLSDGTAEITDYSGEERVLTIPERLDGYKVSSIGEDAFLYCDSLVEIKIPDGLTNIGHLAFYGCGSLEEISIPDSVVKIERNPFIGCSSLSQIEVSIEHPTLAIVNGALYDKEEKRLICYPCAAAGTSYTIPQGIAVIGDEAFYYCTSLAEINIPDSVTSIGYFAFYYCKSLAEINIPDSVTSIGDDAFYRCTSLAEISIPDSVTSIGTNPFAGCSSLSRIEVSIEHPTLAIVNGALYEKEEKRLICYPCAAAGTSYTIPQSIAVIGDDAFYDCDLLIKISIPDSVTSIGDNAFSYCTSLAEISIPDSVTSIGDRAFSDCTSLAEISIPDSVTSIGDYAFCYCTSLAEISIPDSVTSIGDRAFSDCTSLAEISIPDSVTSIGNAAFSDCPSLTLSVETGSYAAQYAKENDIKYTYSDALAWLES